MRPLAKTTRNEADSRGVDQDAELRAAFERLRSGVASHPRAVSAVSAGGPSHPRAVIPLGDKVPPQRAFDNLPSGPPSSFQQLRELHERHRREDADIRAVLRRARAACRPTLRGRSRDRGRAGRELGAQVAVAAGRDSSGERDDGGGSGDSDGPGGGGSDPPPRLGARVLGCGGRP